MGKPLKGKTILITGAARRIGQYLAITAAKAGADIIIHHGHSQDQAEETAKRIRQFGSNAWIVAADFTHPTIAANKLEPLIIAKDVSVLINNAAIFKPIDFFETKFEDWKHHLAINLTTPFLLCQLIAKHLGKKKGRIINIIDWRALRPGKDHFPYSISKAALAAMTKAMALSLAPNIVVNGLALGAILPPSNGGPTNNIIKQVPAGRWAELDEVGKVFLFLLAGPEYVTGEIIHVDGGRHLV
ncbi:MAG TPA: SDR family oxidoreductase [Anaerolineae bacterium]|nr:SDR family oxidoreductase [Anaerolineae bacterium]